MKTRTLIIVILALLIILILLPFAVYSIEETELTYETISLKSDNPFDQPVTPKILVLTGPEQIPTTGISQEESMAMEQVDYEQNFVILIFLGVSTSPENKIASIKQYKTDVWIKAEIQASPEGEKKYSPYQIIKIAKEQLPQTGKLDFILLNNLYEEKSRAKASITMSP